VTSRRRGVALTPMETRRDVIVRAAMLADELGYEIFALPEGWGLDPAPVLTEIALRTSRISPRRGTVPSGARVVLDQLAACGTYDQVREQLQPWDHAADIVTILLPPGLPWPNIEATLQAAAPAAGAGRSRGRAEGFAHHRAVGMTARHDLEALASEG
jgi:alkanesulfonate monooxygenase SsuD/methylene tetrahydromethanopterin reductase-like flavin-dependent oxidoreductase (luciferase family)